VITLRECSGIKIAFNGKSTQPWQFFYRKGKTMTLNISSKLAIALGVLLSTITTTGFAANPLQGNPFLDSSNYFASSPGDDDNDQDCDKDQDQNCDKDHDKDCDNSQDKDCDKGDQDCDKDQDKDCDQDQDDKYTKMRVDCRYHNDKGDDKGKESVRFCYASAIYTPKTDNEYGTVSYNNVQLGVGCDQQTIYNHSARVHTETVSERISPQTAAFPAVEIFPQGALMHTGTYESVLDIRAGRLNGVCYVHEM